MTRSHETIALVDRQGRRRYTTAAERKAFTEAAYSAAARERTICFMLAFTGCRIAEAVDITAADIDFAGEAIFLGVKDKQRRGVPVPPFVLEALDGVHGIRHAQRQPDGGRSVRLWPVDRTTVSRWVAPIMKRAGIEGPHASHRGLRHGFGVQAVKDGVPPETLRQWMGYASPEMVEVYADPPGEESP